ncbi:hypothetical protein OHS33_17650 [Streptomyces sp. NBC_00536]|uniref:hypothetical protein n=1 Tax=Streptomyces sp. NBC_00536 TaxID=2975769 RepID=UPI002E811226|nr:hypothetical protein [Streptomyces sp. NBC_00536]WUC80008.1 hypothetical protein OHS33_17650 [Streptomyces sp. NBC_00536]
MSGTRYARTVRAALARALTVACVVLLCAFGAGSAAAAAGPAPAPRPAAAAEPAESDPGADPEVRAVPRSCARGIAPRRTPEPGTRMSRPPAARAFPYASGQTEGGSPTVRSVVLRC